MRADKLLCELGIFESRSKAASAIEQGRVSICGEKVLKTSREFELLCVQKNDVEIEFDPVDAMVGRAGLKLSHALEIFGIDVNGKRCIDIGASTGGFTQCLLEKGAKIVYAVDVGKDQLHESLKNDKRVVSIEQFNARNLNLENVDGTQIDVAVMDVSFISQTLLYDATKRVLKNGGVFISLIKPQFELSRGDLGKSGVVKNARLRHKAVDRVVSFALSNGFKLIGKTESPIFGGSGNAEFLAAFVLEE